MLKKFIFTCFAAMIFSCLLTTSITAESSVGTEIGDKAPDFEAETLDGETVKLSDFEGERIMLNFWTTWCPPCREEMPDIQKFHETSDVVILAVNLTDTEMNKNNVTAFIEEFDFTFPVLMDEGAKVSNLYKINPIPMSYMIDSNGKIHYKAFGAMDYELMVEEFAKMK